MAQMAKASTYSAGDLGSIPGSERCPGEGNGNLLQYSCLENRMDGGAWRARIHEVTNSQTQLSDFTFFLTEAEDINKRWQEYTEEMYKTDLHDPDRSRWCDRSPRARYPGM